MLDGLLNLDSLETKLKNLSKTANLIIKHKFIS